MKNQFAFTGLMPQVPLPGGGEGKVGGPVQAVDLDAGAWLATQDVVAVVDFTELPWVARCAASAAVLGGVSLPVFRAQGLLAQPGAVFVTLRGAEGILRGCRGVITPTEATIVRETCLSAVAAALHDLRFPVVTAKELPQLRFSVTVLDPLEPVGSSRELDPHVYGVLVTSYGGRRGVLLPAIEGIDSVEQQLAVARRKAGIADGEPVRLERFTARTYAEAATTREGGD